jgi:predicted metal-binding protein
MVRKFVEKVPEQVLQQDLQRYRQRAIELGASDAKIITRDLIALDERVRAKCLFPKCEFYGTNANCPPYTIDLDQTRKITQNYCYGILIRIDVPSENIAGLEASQKRLGLPYSMKRQEIVSKIELEAFNDGYHLALGFGGGSCKNLLCREVECSALQLGKGCRHPLKARASMEAVGMDVYTMTTRAGWDIYPIGQHTSPSEIPHGSYLGLILIC